MAEEGTTGYAEAKQVFEKTKDKYIEEAIRLERAGQPETTAAAGGPLLCRWSGQLVRDEQKIAYTESLKV